MMTMDELSILKDVSTVVDANKRLPAFVFNEQCTFRVIDFGRLWSKRFFVALTTLNERCGATGFAVAVLEPNPQYFLNNFGHYPVLHFTAAHTPQEYIESVNLDPGGSPADAIIHNSTVVVIKSDNSRWIVYGDRDAEIALIAARDPETLGAVEECLTDSSTVRQSVESGLVRLDASAAEELMRNYE